MDDLVTSKNKEEPNKNEGASVATTLDRFFKHSRADNAAVRGWIWSKFKLIRDVTDVLVTSKNKEDPNKIKGARVATTLNIDFSHSQGQITLQSGVGSG